MNLNFFREIRPKSKRKVVGDRLSSLDMVYEKASSLEYGRIFGLVSYELPRPVLKKTNNYQ